MLAQPEQEPVATMTVTPAMGASFDFHVPWTLNPGDTFYLFSQQWRPATVTLPPLGPADLLVESGQGFVEGWTIQRVKDYACEALRAAGVAVKL